MVREDNTMIFHDNQMHGRRQSAKKAGPQLKLPI